MSVDNHDVEDIVSIAFYEHKNGAVDLAILTEDEDSDGDYWVWWATVATSTSAP